MFNTLIHLKSTFIRITTWILAALKILKKAVWKFNVLIFFVLMTVLHLFTTFVWETSICLIKEKYAFECCVRKVVSWKYSQPPCIRSKRCFRVFYNSNIIPFYLVSIADFRENIHNPPALGPSVVFAYFTTATLFRFIWFLSPTLASMIQFLYVHIIVEVKR